MSTLNRMIATCALFCGLISAAAADDGGWVTCKDGMKMHSGGSCDIHGGILIAPSTSVPTKTIPINASKTPAPKKSATVATPKPQKAAATATRKNVTSKSTRNPTAKCMDGAQYFSRERKGACASHGGVDKWYGW